MVNLTENNPHNGETTKLDKKLARPLDRITPITGKQLKHHQNHQIET